MNKEEDYEDYDENALFLGVCEKQIDDSADTDLYMSKLGGKPVFPNEKAPKDKLKCKVCSSKLYLLTQIFAPLEDLDRFLYIFACNNNNCRNKEGSWLGIRYQCDPPKVEKKEEKKQEEWTDKIEVNEIDDLLKMRDLKIEVKKKKKVEIQKIDYQFTCFPLYLFEDDYDPEDEVFYHEKKLYRDYEKQIKTVIEKDTEKDKFDEDDEEDEEEIIDNGDDNNLQEKYEDFSKDKIFDKFQKVLSHTPDQVLRTQFDMEVLWTSDKPEFLPKGTKIKDKQIGKVDIPKCTCGAPRVPELQVIPTSIYILQCDKFNHLKGNDGLDFGTAILYTCAKKCGKEEYSFEHVHVQPPIE